MPNAEPDPAPDEVRELIEPFLGLEGPLLPICHALQEAFGCVPQGAMPVVAEALNISKAEVHGVVSFYHDFRSRPAGRHVLRICRAEACQAVGADPMAEAALKRLGVGWSDTTPNGRITVEAVFCLGLCACGPAVMLDGQLHGRVDGERISELLEGVGA